MLREQLAENKQAANSWGVGDAVQYYKDGWRVGRILEVGMRRNAGMFQFRRPPKKPFWVPASDVRRIPA